MFYEVRASLGRLVQFSENKEQNKPAWCAGSSHLSGRPRRTRVRPKPPVLHRERQTKGSIAEVEQAPSRVPSPVQVLNNDLQRSKRHKGKPSGNFRAKKYIKLIK